MALLIFPGKGLQFLLVSLLNSVKDTGEKKNQWEDVLAEQVNSIYAGKHLHFVYNPT